MLAAVCLQHDFKLSGVFAESFLSFLFSLMFQSSVYVPLLWPRGRDTTLTAAMSLFSVNLSKVKFFFFLVAHVTFSDCVYFNVARGKGRSYKSLQNNLFIIWNASKYRPIQKGNHINYSDTSRTLMTSLKHLICVFKPQLHDLWVRYRCQTGLPSLPQFNQWPLAVL